MSGDWIPTAYQMPKRGQAVEWLSPHGGEGAIAGEFRGVWIIEHTGTYVYYTPAFWRPR